MGKGSRRRPRQTSREEDALRSDLAYGVIPRKAYDFWMAKLKKDGKIIRSGKVIR